MGRWLLLLLAGLAIMAWSVNRDIRYTRAYPGDLRNRIVGARMVKDGHLPYLYKWKQGEGLRYYDPDNFDSLRISNITGSPFYLHLLSPVADASQAQINVYWLVSEYLILAVMTGLAMIWAGTTRQKQTVLLFSLLFLLGNPWKSHVSTGQTYLWIPALAMLFLAAIRKPGGFGWGLAAGLIAATLVLIRINFIFFFPPFLFIARRYTRGWWIAFCLGVLLLLGGSLVSPHERALWENYHSLLTEAVKAHQRLGATIVRNASDPHFAHWEGIDKPAADSLSLFGTEKIYAESGNVFVVWRLLFQAKLPADLLEPAAAAIALVLYIAFYFGQRPFRTITAPQLAIFGFCLYMISDLFSPIYRLQYYSVQWIFPLLSAAAIWGRDKRRALFALTACLGVFIIHFPYVKMQNTIAEYALMAVLLGSALFSDSKRARKTAPVSLPVST